MFAPLRSLFRLLFVWKVSETRPDELEDVPPDCIVMQAFGQVDEPMDLGGGLFTGGRIVPGRANEEIARLVVWHLRETLNERIPVLAQWEFTETRYFKQEHKIRFTPLGSRSEYRNTREIIAEGKRIMDENGWKTAVIVAHPWHLARCIWTAEKLGIRTVYDQALIQDLNEFAVIWNKGVAVPLNQIQTTSFTRWLWYEFRARAYFWLKGWI